MLNLNWISQFSFHIFIQTNFGQIWNWDKLFKVSRFTIITSFIIINVTNVTTMAIIIITMMTVFIITMMMVTRFKASSWVRSECSPMRRERGSRREISWSASMGKRWSFTIIIVLIFLGPNQGQSYFGKEIHSLERTVGKILYCLRWTTRMRVSYICIVGDNSIQIFKMPIHSPHIWQTSLWWSLLMMIKGVWDGPRGCLSPHCQGWN